MLKLISLREFLCLNAFESDDKKWFENWNRLKASFMNFPNNGPMAIHRWSTKLYFKNNSKLQFNNFFSSFLNFHLLLTISERITPRTYRRLVRLIKINNFQKEEVCPREWTKRGWKDFWMGHSNLIRINVNYVY